MVESIKLFREDINSICPHFSLYFSNSPNIYCFTARVIILKFYNCLDLKIKKKCACETQNFEF